MERIDTYKDLQEADGSKIMMQKKDSEYKFKGTVRDNTKILKAEEFDDPICPVIITALDMSASKGIKSEDFYEYNFYILERDFLKKKTREKFIDFEIPIH